MRLTRILAAIALVVVAAARASSEDQHPKHAPGEACGVSNGAMSPGGSPFDRALAARRGGRWEDAAATLERVRAEAAASGAASREARAALELAATLRILGRTSDAKRTWGEAAVAFDALGDTIHARRARVNAIELDVEVVASFAERQAAMEALRSEAEASFGPPAAADAGIELRLAELWLRLAGDAPGGAAAVERSVAHARSGLDAALAQGDDRAQAIAWMRLAAGYSRGGKAEQASELNARARLVARAVGANDLLAEATSQQARFARAAGDDVAALDAHRESRRLLIGVLDDRTAFGVGEALAFREQAGPIYEGLLDALLRAAAESAESEGREALLAESLAAVAEWRAAELRNHLRDPCLALERSDVGMAASDAWFVHPIELADRVEILVGRRGRLWRIETSVTGEAFRRVGRDLARLIQRKTRQYRRPAGQLYAWLIAPIESRLASAPDAPIVLVPSRGLRDVPPGALWNDAQRRHLAEERAIITAVSLSGATPAKSGAITLSALAAGISVAPDGFEPLPHVVAELDALEPLFDVRALRDAAFSTAAFEEALAKRAYSIVHLATHGVVPADPRDSYLVTHDGRLSMPALARVLRGTRFRERPVDLLTLSACETALGDDRAVLGLGGIALQSGARSVVASLWRVDDEATAALMGRFYRELAESGGQEPARALRRAQMQLIGNSRWQHPKFWAAFMVLGQGA